MVTYPKFAGRKTPEELSKSFDEHQKNRIKSGMNGEMPKITIGKFEISMMTNREDETKLWIQREDGEGGEFQAKLFEESFENIYNKNF